MLASRISTYGKCNHEDSQIAWKGLLMNKHMLPIFKLSTEFLPTQNGWNAPLTPVNKQ